MLLPSYAPRPAGFIEWTSQPVPLSDADEGRKLAAVAEYDSRVKTFGGIRPTAPVPPSAPRHAWRGANLDLLAAGNPVRTVASAVDWLRHLDPTMPSAAGNH